MSDRIKVTPEQFKLFRDTFRKWQRRCGVDHYRIDFDERKLDGDYAEINPSEYGKCARVTLCNELPSDDQCVIDAFDPARHARHEAIHLMLNRLVWLAQGRFVTNEAILEEWEQLVRRIEKLLDDEAAIQKGELESDLTL